MKTSGAGGSTESNANTIAPVCRVRAEKEMRKKTFSRGVRGRPLSVNRSSERSGGAACRIIAACAKERRSRKRRKSALRLDEQK